MMDLNLRLCVGAFDCVEAVRSAKRFSSSAWMKESRYRPQYQPCILRMGLQRLKGFISWPQFTISTSLRIVAGKGLSVVWYLKS